MSPSSKSLSAQTRRNILKGRTFLVTRTKEGNVKERQLLEKYGAKVIELPTIKISPPTSPKTMDFSIQNFEKFDWVLFTSSNGVRLFFQRFAKRRKKLFLRLKVMKKPKFACVGPATSHALKDLGLHSSAMPRKYMTEDLGRCLSRKGITKKKILLARAEVANGAISRILRRAGAILTEAPVYRTVSTGTGRKATPSGLTDITLTSPSTAEGLNHIFSSTELESMKIRLHCIGPVTAARARELGLRIETVSSVHTIDGLIRDIVKNTAKRNSTGMTC